MLQVPKNSVAAMAGLLPTTRGFAGNIVLGDVIVAVDNKPVSYCLFKLLSFLHLLDTKLLGVNLEIILDCK